MAPVQTKAHAAPKRLSARQRAAKLTSQKGGQAAGAAKVGVKKAPSPSRETALSGFQPAEDAFVSLDKGPDLTRVEWGKRMGGEEG